MIFFFISKLNDREAVKCQPPVWLEAALELQSHTYRSSFLLRSFLYKAKLAQTAFSSWTPSKLCAIFAAWGYIISVKRSKVQMLNEFSWVVSVAGPLALFQAGERMTLCDCSCSRIFSLCHDRTALLWISIRITVPSPPQFSQMKMTTKPEA